MVLEPQGAREPEQSLRPVRWHWPAFGISVYRLSYLSHGTPSMSALRLLSVVLGALSPDA